MFCGFFASCKNFPYLSSSNSNSTNSNAVSVDETISAIPFSTKEPEKYQADLVFTFQDEFGETNEQTHTVFRDGANYRLDFEHHSENVSSIQTADGKRVILLHKSKVAAEIEPSDSKFSATVDIDSPRDFLRNLLLNESERGAKYEKIGDENGLTKYRVALEIENEAAEYQSESYLWVDENFKIPIRMETNSFENGQPTGAKTTMEIRNFKLSVDKNVFEIPTGFRKVSESEVQNLLRKLD